MSLSPKQFVKHLVDSELLSAEELSSWLKQFPQKERLQDTKSLARVLVQASKLTEYQASVLQTGDAERLVLGNYVVLDQLGAGGMGQVFLARHRVMDRLVALKILAPEKVNSPEAIQRFRREVRVAAQLEHPNIVAAYDADQARGQHFLIMQYVAGQNLASLVRERGPLAVDFAIRCVLQAAQGLEYAHDKGVIHRDIKPSNLLIDEAGSVKVLDMGLARATVDSPATDRQDVSELTRSDQVMGTVDYMSPEQAEDTRQADERSDVYSLGCTLYWLLSGHAPYRGDTVMKRLLAHRAASIPSLRDLREDIPIELDMLLQAMLAKDPAERPASMSQVIAQVEALLNPEHRGSSGGSSAGSAQESYHISPLPIRTATADPPHLEVIETERTQSTRDTWISARPRSARRVSVRQAQAIGFGAALMFLVLLAVLVVFWDPSQESVSPVASSSPPSHLLHTLSGRTGPSTAVAFSPDRITLAAAEGSNIRLWDLSTGLGGEPLRPVVGSATESEWQILSLTFSPDGRWLATAGSDGSVRLWDTTTRREHLSLPQHDGPACCVTFSDDGELLASSGNDALIRLWRWPQQQLQHQLNGHTAGVNSLSFSGDGRQIASGSDDQTVRLWNTQTGEHIDTLQGSAHPIQAVCFLPDGDRLVAASGASLQGEIRWWDLSTGHGESLLTRDALISSIDISDDGRTMVFGLSEPSYGKVEVYDFEDQTMRPLQSEHTDRVHCVRLSPDGRKVASVSQDGSVQVSDAISGDTLLTLMGTLDIPSCVTFSREGHFLVSAGNTGSIKLWNAKTGDESLTFPRHHGRDIDGLASGIHGLAMSKDGRLLVSGADDGKVTIWEFATGKRLSSFDKHTFPVYSVAFSPDNRTMASAGGEDQVAEVIVWDRETLEVQFQLVGHRNLVSSVKFSPDGEVLATASYDHTIGLWNVEDGQSRRMLTGHTSWVTDICFSPDGSALVSASHDKSVRLWDLSHVRPARTIGRHTGAVNVVDLSLDGHCVLSAGDDRLIRIWDTITLRPIDVLEGHTDSIQALELSPDGDRLATASLDGTIRIWNVRFRTSP